jgi:hypothetical protein
MGVTRYDPSNIDVKTGKPKIKPKVIIGVNTPADKYVPPKADKAVVITTKPAKTEAKAAPKAVAKASSGEGIREAITAMKRREREAGLD